MPLFQKKYDTLTDEKLMAHIQRGDTAAFDELYTRYSKRLLYYFHRMLGGDGEKAQDFLQDLFLKQYCLHQQDDIRICTDDGKRSLHDTWRQEKNWTWSHSGN